VRPVAPVAPPVGRTGAPNPPAHTFPGAGPNHTVQEPGKGRPLPNPHEPAPVAGDRRLGPSGPGGLVHSPGAPLHPPVRPVGVAHSTGPLAGPALAGRHIQLSPSTSVVARADHAGFTAVKQQSPRSSIVLQQQAGPNGRVQVNAYRQVVSNDGRTTTRTYTDGRRTIDAADFHSTGRLNGTQFVQYHNGLHAAFLPNGRPVYAERFTRLPGVSLQAVQRTIYATTVAGRIVSLQRPIVRFYTVNTFGGYSTFVYQPVVFPAPFYGAFYAPLGFPIVVGPQCLICPMPTVAFAGPPAQYTDPMDVLGDDQIADAVGDDGVAPEAAADTPAAPAPDQAATPNAPAPEPPPPAPPELMQSAPAAQSAGQGSAPPADAQDDLSTLKTQADGLRAEVTARAEKDAQQPDAAASNDGSLATLHPVALVTMDPAASADPTPIPEDVRGEVRKQVRLSVAQHATNHALTISDVGHSEYARIYLFQVANSLDTVSAIAGDRCELGSGDLLSFADPGYEQTNATLQMKVVIARSGHCLLQDTVEISQADLQEMLNMFNERLENNMRRLGNCAASKEGCLQSS
jgi:hypothetical protein